MWASRWCPLRRHRGPSSAPPPTWDSPTGGGFGLVFWQWWCGEVFRFGAPIAAARALPCHTTAVEASTATLGMFLSCDRPSSRELVDLW